MNIRAKKIRIEFDNPLGDFWEATCGSGIEFDEAMRMITRAWEEHDASAEPLIKDEKIRKAVRAWAEANGYSLAKVGYDMASEPNNGYVQIHFEGTDIVDEDKYGVHTIDELCGEEENERL